MTQITQIGWITDLLDLLVDVSLPVKVGWMLWLAAGVALFAWVRFRDADAPLAVRPLAQTVTRSSAMRHTIFDFHDRTGSGK
jgi:hypothetical protein